MERKPILCPDFDGVIHSYESGWKGAAIVPDNPVPGAMRFIADATDFYRAFDLIVGAEGGYVNDPRDPGGETKYGISKRSYPNEDIANLTLERAKAIYLTDFWMPAKCEQMPWPLSLFVFDSAVNQGPDIALRILQKSAGTAIDGVFGPGTQRAIASANPAELCALFLADRALRYGGTRNFDTYGRGWFARLFRLAMRGA